MLLIYVGQFHCFTHLERSAVGFLQSHDETEECGLAGSVWTDYSYYAVGREREVQVVEQHFFAKCLFYVLSLYHLVAKTRSVGYEYLEFILTLFLLLVEHLLVAV